MRKITLLFVSLFTIIAANAQDYKEVLVKTFYAYDTAKTDEIKVMNCNKLGLIAKKYKDEWAPHYYASFAKAVLSYSEKDATKRDAYLDDADKELQAAVDILKKDNDETYVLAALIANARLSVDGSTRWMKYGPIFSKNLDAAKEINPNNPRIYYLQGVSKMYTPKAFGGGKKVAMPYFEKAAGLFADQTDGDITKPTWGKRINNYYLEECKKEDKE